MLNFSTEKTICETYATLVKNNSFQNDSEYIRKNIKGIEVIRKKTSKLK